MDNVNFVFVKCPNPECGKVLKFKAVPNFREGMLSCPHCGAKNRVKDAKILTPMGKPAQTPQSPRPIDDDTATTRLQSAPKGQPAPLKDEKTRIVGVRARIRCVDDGKEYELEPGVNSIGRAASQTKAKLTFNDPDMFMSRLHATITFVTAPQPALHLKDEGSANGTFIRDVRIPAGSIVKLVPGIRFKMGNRTFECILTGDGVNQNRATFDNDPTELV